MTKFILALLFLLQMNHCFSMDIVRWNHGNLTTDQRRSYKSELITLALEKTIPLYGPYRLVEANQGLVINRAIQQIQDGQSINIFMAVTSPEWESKTIPIRIPIRRGILNYRLLAIDKDHLPSFKNIKDTKNLKNFTAGLRRGWATVALFENYDYPIIQTTTLDGLYHMLSHKRVDYIPRGINEIFGEINKHIDRNNNLTIEPTLALYTQAPYYIFVSLKEKRLAKRLEAGLEMMIADKSLKKLFYKYYADNINKAQLNERSLIRIDNPTISTETPLTRRELWFEYD